MQQMMDVLTGFIRDIGQVGMAESHLRLIL